MKPNNNLHYIGARVLKSQTYSHLGTIIDVIYSKTKQEATFVIIDTGEWFTPIKVIDMQDLSTHHDFFIIENETKLQDPLSISFSLFELIENNPKCKRLETSIRWKTT